ncbi:aromatic acid exporter family protein [Isoptericola variabilis]|uniref:Integral membrane protein n=1 Tax=Isoptericola variabilis (strain 225) TaxID=743718 RepID=F6FU25_ISOV2|nr:FUSC family protein [Isoptericola variabilis]AEG43221.1 hypothetical protein Isova_0424 [Isoptericola variabilis 225]TWH35156.1 uncharacterized membrane protein YgaE (UPF0421/DUF939 family) [Isoptericola variabilis J7]
MTPAQRLPGDSVLPDEWTRAQRVYRAFARHPAWSVALRGAVAAALAWVIAILLPDPFSEYPYYAPLGAVVATTGTVVRSAMTAVRATAAILLGAGVARLVDLVLEPGAASVALAVGLALLVSTWRVLGDMGLWAVTSALFVLILGQANPEEYVGAYSGLVALGAGVGVVINLLVPPLPLTPSEEALDQLRDVLVDQAEDLADGLDREHAPSSDEWPERQHSIDPVLSRARESVHRSGEAARANVRVRRYRRWVEAQRRRSRALLAVAAVVDDAVRLATEWERRDRDEVALGTALRPPAVAALRALAQALRTHGLEGADPGSLERLAEAIEHLRARVREVRAESEQDYFVAGALVLQLRRAHEALVLSARGADR